MEERIQTVGIRDVHEKRMRVTYTTSGVELDLEGDTYSFLKDTWQAVIEASILQWGRQLRPAQIPSVNGVAKMTALAHGDTVRIPINDACENCGSGFGPRGTLIHFPTAVGVCELQEGPGG